MKRGYFIFGDVDSSEHGIFISVGSNFDGAAPEIETMQIPGRNGDIVIKSDRYSNYEIAYPAFSFARTPAEFSRAISGIRSALAFQRGYQRLWTSYEPEIYRQAIYTGGLQTSMRKSVRSGEFEVKFECKPQRYLISGDLETEYNSGGCVFNPTRFNSKPLLKVTGHGTLGIGDYTAEIEGDASTVTYIDCDAMEAYSITNGVKSSRNAYIDTGSYFPELEPEENVISYDGTITALSIVPRWWTL